MIDAVMQDGMPRAHAPGAVVVVVADGGVVFAKGYGYADFEHQIPVDPDRTLFRVYSVSKSFTATAAMQLVEEGRLALDRDVNAYLPRSVPATFLQPITLGNLLTHTSGLDDRYLGPKPNEPTAMLPVDTYLTHALPRRLEPPGEIIKYSNHNLILSGYLIEAASGEPFAHYMDAHVLGPLGMTHSSFIARPELAADVAAGYTLRESAYRRLSLTQGCEPSGSLVAPAGEIAHFMIAQLQEGAYGTARILKPETVRLMQSRAFTLDERMPGVCYGFWERVINGERTIEHAGNAAGFISLMTLVPARHQGLFVSVNCDRAGELIGAVQRAYFDRYFPERPAPSPERAPVGRDAAENLPFGTYRRNDYPESGIEKLLLLTRGGEESRVFRDAGGVALAFGPRRLTFVPDGPLLLREASGSTRIAFARMKDGRWLLLFGTYGVLKRLPFYDTFTFQLSWLAAAVGILFAYPILSAGLAVSRRTLGRLPPVTSIGTLAGRVATAVCVVNLLTVACSILVIVGLVSPDFMTGEAGGVPAFVKGALLLPPVGLALTVACCAFAVLVWRRRLWSVGGRVAYTLVALTGVGMAVWFEHWNMLRWWFHD